MICKIDYKKKRDGILEHCLNKLPHSIKYKLLDFLEKNPYKTINEIRLHRNSNIMLIADSKNVKTDIYLTEYDIDEIYNQLCDMSLYAHINTIKQGYISLEHGIRAGICGKATIENNIICGINEISSINIRIPQKIYNASSYLYNLLSENDFKASVILYSSPGVGKTTILRDLISKLSNTNIRYAIIDSRNEITSCLDKIQNGDVFVSYPKGVAIELATKSMTPQIIICDEISSEDEADEIFKSSNAGIELIATTHAKTFDELKNKAIFKKILKNGVFDYALGVEREYGKKEYRFSLNELNENNR